MDNIGIKQDFLDMVSNLTGAVTNIRIYTYNHMQVKKHFEKAFNSLKTLLDRVSQLTFFLVDDVLVMEKIPLLSSNLYIKKLIRLMGEKGVESITFVNGLERSEFEMFIKDLAAGSLTPLRTTARIKLGKVEVKTHGTDDGNTHLISEEYREKLQVLIDKSGKTIDELRLLYHEVKHRRKLDVRGVDEMVKAFVNGFSGNINSIMALGPLRQADEYTFTHVVNVCILTMAQAKALGFENKQLYQIGVAAMLHDCGKFFIPSEIITKPGTLTQQERDIMETHTINGAKYIMGLEGVPKLAVLSAIEHHIKYDGTGYPKISDKWQPNIVSQMISISDAFDAMRSNRPYQKSKPQELVLNILQKEQGSSFNPFLVQNFIKIIGQ